MKIGVVYNTTDAPHGGGNQFIKALKSYFSSQGLLSSEESADVILFNSHHNIDRVARIKSNFPEKKFVHRVDGPMRLYNNLSDTRDFTVYRANSQIADGTVFQSRWSKKANLSLGMDNCLKNVIIHNAVDNKIFYRQKVEKSEKARIICASFSPNPKKGFPVYAHLDRNLDFSRYEMVFAGNSPVKFDNIKNLGCLNSSELALEMNKSHIYLTASENDPCSNSLLEGLACGLPVVARNSGGHPELMSDFGKLFNKAEDVKDCIDHVSANIEHYTSKIQTTQMDKVGAAYVEFFRSLY